MQTTFRTLFLIVLFSFLYNTVTRAQTVHAAQVDGELYVRTVNCPLVGDKHAKIPPAELPFVDGETMARFGITGANRPFWHTKTPLLQSVYRVQFSQHAKIDELIRTLEQLPMVDYAEPVPLHQSALTPNDLGANTTNGTGQWGLWKIKAQQAWDVSTGNTAIKVAVVDNAVKINHPDLAPAIWVNPGEIPNNNIDDDANGYVDDINGYDVAQDDENVMPWSTATTHGTHVAGIVGAASNNGIGIASIGHGITIIPVSSSYSSTQITHGFEGVAYAGYAGADVINLSWGGSLNSQTGLQVIDYVTSQGALVVAAAGNDNSTALEYPAAYANVIAVASTTNADAKSSFSNYGSWVDISAPGSSIYSTYFTSLSNNTYAFDNGTSMASPMVAGLCGLMLSYNPSLTQSQLKYCLYTTADTTTSHQGQMGAGRINAARAMQCLSTPPQASISAGETDICPGASVQFYGHTSAGFAGTYQWTFPGGTPATSTLQNPVVTYPNAGSYAVKVVIGNPAGSSVDSIDQFVNVSSAGMGDLIFAEDFEGTSLNMHLNNPDNSTTWALWDTQGNLSGNQSAAMRYYSYNAPGQRDGLITPTLSFAFNGDVELSFTHAYARYNQSPSDSLIVKVSVDNGSTWARVWGAGENGSGNFATHADMNSSFLPAVANDWCHGGSGASCVTVPLTAFAGKTGVKVMFEGYNRYGNNLYIDDIVIRGTCEGTTAPTVAYASAGSVCQGQAVSFTNQSLFASSYLWEFPGGTPAGTNAIHPNVTYNTPGTYSVTLTATGPGGSTSETYVDVITVNPTPDAAITFSNGVFTATPAGHSYKWYKNNTLIPGATGQTYIPASNGNYSAGVTNSDNCMDISNIIAYGSASLEDVASAMEWNIFPNPAQAHVTVTWADNGISDVNIRLLNAVGQEIQTVKGNLDHTAQLPLHTYAPGVYYIGVRFGEHREVMRKLVIAR